MENISESFNEYLKTSDINEFELLFNNGNISFDNFVNILNVLKNSEKFPNLYDNHNLWKMNETTNSLDIQVHPDEKSSSLDLRWTLTNLEDIQKYCKTNDLSTLDYELIFKKPVKKPLIDDEFNLKYNLKTENPFDMALKKFISDDVKSEGEYLRFKRLLQQNRGNFKYLYKTYRLKNRYSFTDKYNLHSLDLTVIRTSKKKIFNGKEMPVATKNVVDSNIFNESQSYEIELEINKFISTTTTKVELKQILDKMKTNKIKVDDLTFEVFIDTVSEELINGINKTTEFVYKSIYKYPYIMSKTENIKISDEYKNFIKFNKLEIIRDKLDTIIKGENKEADNTFLPHQLVFLEQIGKMNDTKIHKIKLDYTTLIQKITDNDHNLNYFIGPKPVSMEIEHLQNTNENYILNTPFCVTDKADGIGMLMFVTNEHQIYLIDNNMKIYKTGLQCDNFINCIFNTEYLPESNLVMVYDTYYMDNKSVSDDIRTNYKYIQYRSLFSNVKQEDISLKTRIEMGEYFLENGNIRTIDDDESIIKINIKKFSDVSLNFSKNSKLIWDKRLASTYKYDGLIYTPSNFPVGWNKSIDYDLYTHTRWDLNIKWKPPFENTIDFLIRESDEDNIIQIDKDNELTTIKKYKVFELFVGQNVKYKSPCDTQFKNYRKHNNYLPERFSPTQPYTKNIYKAYIEICPETKKCFCKNWNEEKSIWEKTNIIIKSDTIVEFSYDLNNFKQDNNFKWIPVKIRNDKTFNYKKAIKERERVFNIIQELVEGDSITTKRYLYDKVHHYLKQNPVLNKINFSRFNEFKNYINTFYLEKGPSSIKVNINYGNDYSTACNVWKTIHNPVNENILMNVPDNVPIELDNESKYYNKDLQNSRDKSLTISLQEFHNKIIKQKLLLESSMNYISVNFKEDFIAKNISLLDLATGKGGDLFKWKTVNLNHVIGIDIIKDNIYNPNDGACVRRNNLMNKPVKPENFDVSFIQGDVSKNILSGQAFSSESTSLYNEKFKDSISNFHENKFHIISIMFAIHYMFQNEDDLNELVKNIDENLKSGGIFIGTCLDGHKTFEFLKDMDKDDTKTGITNDGNLLWTMTKKYDKVLFNNDISSLNYGVSIKMHSINQEIDEYLVNFDLLKQKLQERNIHLIDDYELNTDKTRMKSTDTFDNIFSTLKRFNTSLPKKTFDLISNMSEAEQQISFLTRYFIFKKK